MRWTCPGLRRALRLGLVLPGLLLIHPVAGHGDIKPEKSPPKESAKSATKSTDGRSTRSVKGATGKVAKAAGRTDGETSRKAAAGSAGDKSAKTAGRSAGDKSGKAAAGRAGDKSAKAAAGSAGDKSAKAAGRAAGDKPGKTASGSAGDKSAKAAGRSAGDKPGKTAAGRAAARSGRDAQKTARARAADPDPCMYTVKSGDSVTRVAARHGVSRQSIVAANHLARRGALTVGKRLTVPGCAANRAPEVDREIAFRASPPTEGILLARVGPRRVPTQLFLGPAELNGPSMGNLLWPVAGPIVSGFGLRRSGWHAGLDIKAEVGTPILAAAAGTVLVSGWEPAYGRVIKIEHDNGFVTVYAHNLQNLVIAGDRVDAGTVVGTVGRTGRSTAYHLHFEVRRDGLAYNPLHVLPDRDVMVARSDESTDAEAEEAEDESPR